ncbi:hypothetical protein [Bradyrhizobium oligotrophicum]|uniref:hypothetical protein n=1 Tax=Bradyrhizobium oligotrophicum TaxID=44255 RepID=UPI001181C2C3|nr:hypothetical protein [Bradyrhizobium oligotrophicum]
MRQDLETNHQFDGILQTSKRFLAEERLGENDVLELMAHLGIFDSAGSAWIVGQQSRIALGLPGYRHEQKQGRP